MINHRCIFFCSVRHKLLDELLERIGSEGVIVRKVDCTYSRIGRVLRFLTILSMSAKILRVGIFSKSRSVLVFHYLSAQVLLSLPILVFIGKPIVLHFWGTDYAKFSRLRSVWLMRSILNRVSIVTFANQSSLDDFCKRYPKVNVKKLTFGLESLDYIDQLSLKDSERPSRKPVVVCGTNASPNQQTLEVIDALDAWVGKKECYFIFPLAYGDDEYRDMVKKRLNQSMLNYETSEEFLTGRKLAEFRCGASVLVQVQKFDFLSGSMLEHIYAGTKVVTGSWLPYDQLRRSGIEWFEVGSIDQVPSAIAKAILSDINVPLNKQIVSSIARWDVVIKNWANVYKATSHKRFA